MGSYNWDLAVAWILRFALTVSIVLSALALAACSSRGIQGTVNGSVVDPAVTLDRSASTKTGNQIPQGGSDEKSRSTPTEPAK